MGKGITRREFWSFVAGGLAVGVDLVRAFERDSHVPWLDEIQRLPEPLAADAPRLPPLLVDRAGQPITTLEHWETRRQEIRQWWKDFLGILPPRRGGLPRLEVLAEDRPGHVLRQHVRYEVETGILVEAYLLKPVDAAKGCPGAVVLHSTTDETIRQPAGLGKQPEKAFGLKLAERGWVALCPCNFLWPEGNKIATQRAMEQFRLRHPHSKGMAKMLYDAVVALDLLASFPEVDPCRLGAVGHSLGAKEVLYLAAMDDRVRVAVSSEGGIGLRFSNWDASWYLGEAIRREDFSHEHHELLALVAPRAFLLVGGESADGARSWPFIEGVLPVYRLYGKPARIGLFNHKKGHSVPPEAEQRIYQWLETYG